MKNNDLTVIIPTKEEDLDVLASAMESVKWADEILIIDSSFSNKIEKIAKTYKARYLTHQYSYSAKQKNWAIPQAKNKWILLLDSDEVVTDKLKKEITRLLNSDEIRKYDGFGIARKHFFFGKFLRWGGRYPLYNVRLFRKNCRYEDRDVHAHIILDKKKVKNISPKFGDILHFSDRNFSQFFERFDRYSTYQANYLKKIADKHANINWKEFFTNFYYFKAVVKDVWFFVPATSFLRFVYMYFLRLGFLDGRNGLTIALLYSLQDYVSKTKFYMARAKSPVKFRFSVQDFFIKNIASIGKYGQEKVNFIKNYKEKVSIAKQ